MLTRTKIICTLGPAVASYQKILSLIDTGMNVARINFSHGTHKEHKKTIHFLKKARDEKGIPLAIMLDTKGPEIRVGVLKKPILVRKGQRRLLGKKSGIPIIPSLALESLKKGDRVLFDNGYISSKVVEITSKGIVVEFLDAGKILSQKGVNIPKVSIPLPSMTKQDVLDITFGCKEDIDLIAASFIRSAEHVQAIKSLLLEQGKEDILVIAKIENSLGVENFDTILPVADGIMIARGDLGVELPIEEVPALQKMMIRKCLQCSKPVIIATQMLESMMQSPGPPTRAEASDVANAVYDSTTAVMLSGETAIGKYPIETLETMKRIVTRTERDFPYKDFFYRDAKTKLHDISSSIALASVNTAYSSEARGILAFTSSGFTAHRIARFRPEIPILALTTHKKTYHQLALSWGVIPIFSPHVQNAREALEAASTFARDKGFVEFGDLVVVTAGTPFGIMGTTNMMAVESIGEVLVRGEGVGEGRITGQIQIILTPDAYSSRAARNKIVVFSKYDSSYLPVIERVKGIILQNHPEDTDSVSKVLEEAKKRKLPILIHADAAFYRLYDGQTVLFDPKQGIVYKKISSFSYNN